MFVYGPSKIADEPSRVLITLKGETTARTFPLQGGTGCIVAPGGEVVIVATPPPGTVHDPRKTPMRVLWAFPWDTVQCVQFEYDTPFPDMLAEADEDQELKDLEEMIQRPGPEPEESVN